MRPLRATVYIYSPDAPENMIAVVVELPATDAADFRTQVRLRYPNPSMTVECAVVGVPWRLQRG